MSKSYHVQCRWTKEYASRQGSNPVPNDWGLWSSEAGGTPEQMYKELDAYAKNNPNREWRVIERETTIAEKEVPRPERPERFIIEFHKKGSTDDWMTWSVRQRDRLFTELGVKYARKNHPTEYEFRMAIITPIPDKPCQ